MNNVSNTYIFNIAWKTTQKTFKVQKNLKCNITYYTYLYIIRDFIKKTLKNLISTNH